MDGGGTGLHEQVLALIGLFVGISLAAISVLTTSLEFVPRRWPRCPLRVRLGRGPPCGPMSGLTPVAEPS